MNCLYCSIRAFMLNKLSFRPWKCVLSIVFVIMYPALHSAAAYASEPREIIPLAVGNEWHYNGYVMKAEGDKPLNTDEKTPLAYIARISALKELDDSSVYLYEIAGNLRVYLTHTGNSLLCYKKVIFSGGKEIYNRKFSPPEVIARLGIPKETRWSLEDGATVEYAGQTEVTTHAGSFDTHEYIIHMQSPEGESYTHKYYSPGVGLVQEITAIKKTGREHGDRGTARKIQHHKNSWGMKLFLMR